MQERKGVIIVNFKLEIDDEGMWLKPYKCNMNLLIKEIREDKDGDIFIRLSKNKKVQFIDSYKNVLMIKLKERKKK